METENTATEVGEESSEESTDSGRPKEKVIIQMYDHGSWVDMDLGPDDLGFRGKSAAVAALKKHVEEGLDTGAFPSDNIPELRVIRIVAEVAPKPVERVEIDFGDV